MANTAGAAIPARSALHQSKHWAARLLGSWTQTYDLMVGNQIIDGVGGYNAATFGSPNPGSPGDCFAWAQLGILIASRPED